jgi:hypothetical protein
MNTLDNAVRATVSSIALNAIFNSASNDQIEDNVDLAFETLGHVFTDSCIDDTVTRRLAKVEVFALVKGYKGDIRNFAAIDDYVEAAINLEELFNDIYYKA